MSSEKLREELAKAKMRVAEWQAKAKDLERRIVEQENLEIVQAVRSYHVTPEELRTLVDELRQRKAPGSGAAAEREKTGAGESLADAGLAGDGPAEAGKGIETE